MNPSTPRNPILLLHGIWDTGAIFRPMTRYLNNLGWETHDLNLTPNNGDGCLKSLAQQVAEYADRVFTPETPFDLLGFSMGGIVGRYYLQRLGGLDRVQRFISLSSPHGGTWVAYGSLRQGCMQMRPQHPFLRDLNQDIATLDRVNFTSIWTPLDAMILPASSSQVPVGRDVKVWVPLHRDMVSHPQSLKAVANALVEPVKTETGLQPLSGSSI
ncbi:lipase [Stenomitos frigidus ULC18]|uniref:Lipase n=2 Tax=Stenomitos TaxID=1844270 RepID=A0A2T1ECH6_9CYAN|nr:lipase [Stenomitos frigidus ULC18]